MTKDEVIEVVSDLMLRRKPSVPVKWIDGEPGWAKLEIDGERWTVKLEVLDVVGGTCGFETEVEKENKDA